MDPAAIRTRRELAGALDELRGSRSYGDLIRAARPAKLSEGTLFDMLRKAAISKPKLVVFLKACGLAPSEHEAWISAWERVSIR